MHDQDLECAFAAYRADERQRTGEWSRYSDAFPEDKALVALRRRAERAPPTPR